MSTQSGAVGVSIKRGTKVDDPNAPAIDESTGTITSDSLAAESIRSGGDFAANQSHSPAISGQSSKGFTGSTTDTSGARKVEGGADEDLATTQAALDADVPHGKSAGVGPTYAKTSEEKGTTSHAGVAPTIHHQQVLDESALKPKGQDLQEGGEITGREKNTSYAEIGSRNDPSLAAEQKFTRQNADQGGAGGYGAVNKGDGQYDVLDRNEDA